MAPIDPGTAAVIVGGLQAFDDSLAALIQGRRKMISTVAPALSPEMQAAIEKKSRELDAMLDKERAWDAEFEKQLKADLGLA